MKMAANFLTQALPFVTSLEECASYGTVVEPFIPQFQLLPSRFLQIWNSPHQLVELYLATNPLVTAIWLSLILAPLFLVAAEVTRNYSQVDRFWSILPTTYNAHYFLWALYSGLPMQRLNSLLAISTAWSIRLTFNYWRRGGYQYGSEDYRWEQLRKVIPAPLFFVLDVLFIAVAQSLLLMSITMPTYILLVSTTLVGNELRWPDLVAPWLLMGLVLTSFFADQQQWEFHEAKLQYKKSARPSGGYSVEQIERGFNSKDLFAFVRHPSFIAEQSKKHILKHRRNHASF